GGFKTPVWETPAPLVGLFTGQDVALATYDMPTLRAEFSYSQFFPIIGPVGVKLTGAIGGTAHFGFGYDTAGIKKFKEDGFDLGHVLDLLDGFYVSDRANADGTGDDVPEVTLTGELAPALELNAAIGEVGVERGLKANAGLNLNDPKHDGKVRLGEIVDILSTSPLCLFDASGALTAGLHAFVKLQVGPVKFQKDFDIATLTLLQLEHSCSDEPGGPVSSPEPVLATMLDNGVLRLNMGPNAGARLHGNIIDGNEQFTVTHKPTPEGGSDESVTVSAFGFSQDYHGVRKIIADGGLGNDIIVLGPGIVSEAELSGGVGDDELHGGDGAATLHGGAGNDLLS